MLSICVYMCVLLSLRSVPGQHVCSRGQMLLSKGHKAMYAMTELLLHTWSCVCVWLMHVSCVCIYVCVWVGINAWSQRMCLCAVHEPACMHMAAPTAVTWQRRLQRNDWMCKWVWSVNTVCVSFERRNPREILLLPKKMSQLREAEFGVFISLFSFPFVIAFGCKRCTCYKIVPTM